MKHVASCSFGADSMATVLLAIEKGEPLDEVAYCEVMFSETISGEVPEHADFIREKAIPYLAAHGIQTKILRADWTYKKNFFATVSRGKNAGRIRGFPICGVCTICRDCKLPPIREYVKTLPGETKQYIGIAADEQERLQRLSENRVSLLNKYGYTQPMARELGKRHGMLSPVYGFAPRNGCFFCPNAKETELKHLYEHHPDLWSEMMALQAEPNKCSELFNRTMRFSDYDKLFKLQDAQISIFDFIPER